MANYESDFTVFMRDLKAKQPQLEAQQQQGRSLLWDKEPTSLETSDALAKAKLKQAAYPYQTK